MPPLHDATATRRFSTGERPCDYAGRPVWKFDALVAGGEGTASQKTCYVRIDHRGQALAAVFRRWAGAKVFGTGLPLTAEQALSETGADLAEGTLFCAE